jgi:magnesium transporter
MEENNINLKELLFDAIKAKNFTKVREIFDTYPNIDIADSVNEIDPENADDIHYLVYVFKIIKPSFSSEFFSELDTEIQEKLITYLTNEQVGILVQESANDELADFLEERPANVVAKVLKNTKPDQRKEINQLLGYKDDTAGAIMTTEYITLFEDTKVKDALNTIRQVGKNVETVYTLFVRNKKFDLIGVLNLDDLVFAQADEVLGNICDKTFQTVDVNTDEEEVAQIFKRYDLNAIAVVNEDKKLTGIITIDDIVDVIEKENTEDIEAMGKVAPLKDSYMDTPIAKLAMKCLPWLLVLMVLSIGSIALQNQFQFLIGTLTAISVFLTTICDTGGNSGSQSSTLVIRGLATHDFELNAKGFFKVLWKEFRVALIVASIAAVFTFGFCMFLFAVRIVVIPEEFITNNTNNEATWLIWLSLAGSVSITLFITIIISKLLGVCMPFLVSKMKLDPAVVAGPVITTIMDLVSLSLYFSILLGAFAIFGWTIG